MKKNNLGKIYLIIGMILLAVSFLIYIICTYFYIITGALSCLSTEVSTYISISLLTYALIGIFLWKYRKNKNTKKEMKNIGRK
ncbi:MAG: hypothetical protein ACXABO_18775 [Promethearchaeota archaeon]|jgi:amino acid transporter